MQKIRGAHLARRRRNACAVIPVFADRRRPMRLKPLREPSNILEKLEAIRIGSIPQYPSRPRAPPYHAKGAIDPFGRGGVERGARGGATSEKHGEWYPQVDMAAGSGSRRAAAT
jgi:hypothetical protein